MYKINVLNHHKVLAYFVIICYTVLGGGLFETHSYRRII
jgi:hypothetical protein